MLEATEIMCMQKVRAYRYVVWDEFVRCIILIRIFVWQEDQLGLSLLTLEQLQSEDMLQKIAQIAHQA